MTERDLSQFIQGAIRWFDDMGAESKEEFEDNMQELALDLRLSATQMAGSVARGVAFQDVTDDFAVLALMGPQSRRHSIA